VRGVHGVRLSDRFVLLKSIANPHVILRRCSVSTCTRTREGMSSIVLPVFLVSMCCAGRVDVLLTGRQSWLKTDSGNALLRSTGLARRSVTAVVMGTYSEKARGGWGPPGTWRRTRASYPPTTVPHPPVAEAERTTRDGKRQTSPPHATPMPQQNEHGEHGTRHSTDRTQGTARSVRPPWPAGSIGRRHGRSPTLDPSGALPRAVRRGVMRQQVRTVQ
jgi:hypothetical protein